MIDRRKFVTGLAAVAAAAVVPALPARAVPLGPIDVAIRSRWHYDRRGYRTFYIQHCETGLLFRRRPPSQHCLDYTLLTAEADRPPLDAQTIDTIRVAAAVVALGASFDSRILTAFYTYRPDTDPKHLYFGRIIEDAPPLPLEPFEGSKAARVVN